jgi:hypothetical protein
LAIAHALTAWAMGFGEKYAFFADADPGFFRAHVDKGFSE